MSYPSVIYGRFGDEKKAQSTTFGPALGQKMILPDGREYVHARANTAAALGIGVPIVQKAVAGTSVNLAVATDAAIGATTVVLTMPATTLCTIVDQYAGGFLSVNDVTGEGYTYKIKKSSTAAAASTATFTLEPSDPIKVALANGTSECTIRENTFNYVLDRAAGTGSVGAPAGVPPVAVSAGYYCWLQRRGESTLLAGGTLSVTGKPFACCTVEASFQAWNAAPADTTIAPVSEAWGYTMVAAAASTEYFVGYLQLP
jgi:hypothetical protein